MNALTRVFFSLTSRAPKRKKLVILDDFFPNMYQAYRVSEFKYYCETFPGTQIYSSAEKYDEFLAEYKKAFPEHTKYVHKFSSRKVFRASLFYVVFLHNAAAFLPIIEREHTPFVLNLYAGGYFAFDNPQSDSMLRRVCASPYLKHVVVSQKNIEKYLIEKNFFLLTKLCKTGNIAAASSIMDGYHGFRFVGNFLAHVFKRDLCSMRIDIGKDDGCTQQKKRLNTGNIREARNDNFITFFQFQ